METQGMKVVEELPDNMTGHVVVFEEPLVVHQHVETIEILKGKGIGGGDVKRTYLRPTGKVANCFFMRVEGGFGAYECCSGRMLIGKFFKTIQDVKSNKVFDSGNTKIYPSGFIPELFTEHEKL